MTETTEAFKMILTDQWDDEITKVVGEIAIAFAQLEHVLWLLPKRIDELSLSQWAAMAGKESIPDRCKRIRQRFAKKEISPERLARLDTLLNKIKKTNNVRISVIHGRWGCKKSSSGEIKSLHRIWKKQDKGVDIIELQQLRNDIRSLRDKLLHFNLDSYPEPGNDRNRQSPA